MTDDGPRTMDDRRWTIHGGGRVLSVQHATSVGGRLTSIEHRRSPIVDRPSSVWSLDLGQMEYCAAFVLQRRLAVLRDEGAIPDLLLFVEHDSVITLGRRGSRADVYASDEKLCELGIVIHETNRGGLVTYHGPGQIVGYPIVKLRQLVGDAPRYVSGLEEVIIRALKAFGVCGRREPCHRGVFTDQGKIAAIGVAVSRGVTMHGFALNLQPDLGHFDLINPCGIGDLGVTSVERLVGHPVDFTEAQAALAFYFGQVFDRDVIRARFAANEIHPYQPLEPILTPVRKLAVAGS